MSQTQIRPGGTIAETISINPLCGHDEMIWREDMRENMDDTDITEILNAEVRRLVKRNQHGGFKCAYDVFYNDEPSVNVTKGLSGFPVSLNGVPPLCLN